MRTNAAIFFRTLCAVALCLGLGATASADFMNLGPDFVYIGDVNNPANMNHPTTTNYGRVDYTYAISKYLVTAGEYRDFLNAVDPTGAHALGTLGLYTPEMASSPFGNKITWNAGANTYDFSARPSGSEADWVNRPVNFLSWYDAARYANWKTSGDTASGAYVFDSSGNFVGINRDSAVSLYGVAYVLPTHHEWHKAAYYDATMGDYWFYPTHPTAPPSNELLDPDGGNNANFYGGPPLSGTTVGPPYYRTPVGAFSNSPSPYGTFDQGGNLFEWTETLFGPDGLERQVYGGSFVEEIDRLGADYIRLASPTTLDRGYGFRLGAYYIPEPGSAMMLVFGAIAALLWRRR